MKLTNNIILNAHPQAKPYKLSDGGGMYLYIMPNGKKYWRFKYRFAKKEKTLALGVYPDVFLKEARQKLAEARKQLTNNIDPNAFKKDLKQRVILSQENTFQKIALEWHSQSAAIWEEGYCKRILRGLENDIFPKVGSVPIQEISAFELLKALRIIEQRTVGAAHRMLQVCSQVFRYAISSGKLEIDITISLKGALAKSLKKNYANLSEKELSEFFAKLKSHSDPLIKLALNLLILTFVRSDELREAKWEEIDFEKAEWRIPAERMKMQELHIVPLSSQTIKILRELQGISGNRAHLFPSPRNPHTHISENILLHTIYDLGYKKKATVHGFRATASTILNENGWSADVIERQLAHTERNKVRASYNHAQHLPERRKMLQWWGDFIDQQSGKNVIQIKRSCK